jgi:bifunctional non-homologous end joining protein LigD
MAATTVVIPRDAPDVTMRFGPKAVRLTNLNKVFFPELGLKKGDLLQYYADVAPVLLPHLKDRAMVMKRYPNGQTGDFFFMKRTPPGSPEWLRHCAIPHDEDAPIDAPVIDDLPALLWVINLGCIDLNQWYARCDDVDRPDYLHFDLDPVKGGGTPFETVLKVALDVRDGLTELGLPCYAKTSGSAGIHVYVPIVRGPEQHDVWRFAKAFASALAAKLPDRITVVYAVSRRPRGRVLLDYNQNAWGRTLASVYSVRPTPRATVSTPLTWAEVERGVAIEDFRVDNIRERIARVGDLWKPLLAKTKRANLAAFMSA